MNEIRYEYTVEFFKSKNTIVASDIYEAIEKVRFTPNKKGVLIRTFKNDQLVNIEYYDWMRFLGEYYGETF